MPANPPPEWVKLNREESRRHFTAALADPEVGGRGCEATRELMASCRRSGVPTALVLMPEGPTCRAWYAPEAWPRIQGWVQKLAAEEGVPLINAREWIDEDGFVDSHHLLPRGAGRFTDRLGREAILPLLRLEEETRP